MATSKVDETKQSRKVAIVTGAPGNLGRAVVKKFIDEGYFIAGTILPNTPAIDFGEDKFEGYKVDLTNDDAARQFIESVIKKHGSVNAAILTAGGFAMGNIENTGIAAIQAQHKLNFETAYNVARPVLVHMMKQNSGRIFLIGSKPGLDAVHGKATVAYTLAKSLIFRLAEIMNSEAKGTNVVTTVSAKYDRYA